MARSFFLSRRTSLKAGAVGITALTLGGRALSVAAQDSTPADSCPDTTPEENLTLAKRWFTDLPDALPDLITDDFTIEHGMGPDVEGQEQVLGRLMAINASVPGSTHEYTVEATDGDLVILRWKGMGTFDVDYLGHPATGEEVTLSGIHIFRIACGRIAQIWAETNLYAVHLQLSGAMAATPAA